MYIAIDFDGTCVTHEYPEIGKDVGAVPVLKKIVEKGHKLILHTMRSHPIKGQSNPDLVKRGLIPISRERDTLQEAIDWFKQNDIPLYAVNDNPSQRRWTTSRKVYAHLYIDDAALGIPLIHEAGKRPYVDWGAVEKYLQIYNIIY